MAEWFQAIRWPWRNKLYIFQILLELLSYRTL